MAVLFGNSLQRPRDTIIGPHGDLTLVVPDKGAVLTPGSPRLVSKASSKHLTFASAYFKARLGTDWPEGKDLIEMGSAELTIGGPGCDYSTLSIILHIFHALGRRVPKSVSTDALLNIAVATDYLQCHAAVEEYGLR